MGRGDWVVGSSTLTAAGVLVSNAVSTWGVIGLQVLANNARGSWLLYGQLPAAPSPTPTPTDWVVNAVHGSISIDGASVTGNYDIAIAMYISTYNTDAAAWATRNPVVAMDSQRDDYLLLRGFSMVIPAPGAITAPIPIDIPIGLPEPIELGQGQGLVVTVSNGNLSVGNLTFTPWFRAHVTAVA